MTPRSSSLAARPRHRRHECRLSHDGPGSGDLRRGRPSTGAEVRSAHPRCRSQTVCRVRRQGGIPAGCSVRRARTRTAAGARIGRTGALRAFRRLLRRNAAGAVTTSDCAGSARLQRVGSFRPREAQFAPPRGRRRRPGAARSLRESRDARHMVGDARAAELSRGESHEGRPCAGELARGARFALSFVLGPLISEHEAACFPWDRRLTKQHNSIYLVRVEAHEPRPTIDPRRGGA